MTHTEVADALEESRARTLRLLEPIDGAAMTRQVSTLMSPLVWDLAHIAYYEELWLLRELHDVGPTDVRFDDLYDAFKHPRAERPSLDLLDPPAADAFARDVRARVLDTLDRTDFDADDPRLADGFLYGMVAQHEHQHVETMLATLNLVPAPAYPRERAEPATPPTAAPASVLVPGGPFTMGTSSAPWAYDNERPAHEVHVEAFRIDTMPVTNAAYCEFVDGGGYDADTCWSEAGRAWRDQAGLVAPMHWERDGDAWVRRRFGRVEPLPLTEPVQHVCWYEADAYARWRGARLPTEAEWEKAATWDPATGRSRRWPWGDAMPARPHAQLAGGDAEWLGPAPVGAHPAGASALGVHDLVGGVWEWTATDFDGYPGFRSFPYREYSEVFFGTDYKVLRGGSWATHPHAARPTFRNWDFPIRRQIFAGFRCASDA